MGSTNSTPQTPPQTCPVDHQQSTNETKGCPIDHTKTNQTETATKPEGCPVQHDSDKKVVYNVYAQPINPTNQMPLNPNQLPAVGQEKPLETKRVVSSIPKGGTTDETWTYPSPQMFYNALMRKGKGDDVDEEIVDTIVAIHNNMNEKTWDTVMGWEALHQETCCSPKLYRFMGRPDDLSPKAWFKSTFLGFPKPFDRHDWYVDRCGKEVRYVIDYYHDEEKGKSDEVPELNDYNSVKSISLDVRPAVDSIESLFDRIRMPLLIWSGNAPSVETLRERQKTEQYNNELQGKRLAGEASSGCPVDHKKMQAAKMQNETPAPEETKPTTFDDLDKEKVMDTAKQFSTNCAQWFTKVQECSTEDECQKASTALNFCMADIICKHEATLFLKHTNSGKQYSDMVSCLEKFEAAAQKVAQKKES